jgi:alpha-tubulin suppressor-like RCC1 family protein
MPINESNTVQYTVTTTNTADGTTLYWKTTGNTTNADIVGGNTGSITITNNQAIFNVTILADVTTDGTKTLGIAIATGSLDGPTVVSTTNPITVNDTSRSPQYTLYFWGRNVPVGISGTNDSVDLPRSSPVQIGTSSWNLISVGQYNTAAVQTNGTLWTWGSDYVGSLGRPDKIYRSSPTQVGALTTWAEVATSSHALAVKTDGTLWAWGLNVYGTLGTNNDTTISSPVQVGTGTNWSKVAAVVNASFALKTDGTLWSWGYNQFGQLGLNLASGAFRSSPVQVGSPNGYSWTTIGVGRNSVGAITSDGSLFTWGRNDTNTYGSLGLNSSLPYSHGRSQPTQVSGSWSKIDFCTGDTGFVGIKSNGTLWATGYGFFIDGGNNRSSPVQIGVATNWLNVYGNKFGGFATKTDNTAWAWGQNNWGGLGQNNTTAGIASAVVQLGTGEWRNFASTKTSSNDQTVFGTTLD